MAERGGFEPPRPVTQSAAFRVRCFQPLSHLSGLLRSASCRSEVGPSPSTGPLPACKTAKPSRLATNLPEAGRRNAGMRWRSSRLSRRRKRNDPPRPAASIAAGVPAACRAFGAPAMTGRATIALASPARRTDRFASANRAGHSTWCHDTAARQPRPCYRAGGRSSRAAPDLACNAGGRPMIDAYIYDGLRTPFGRHSGALAKVRPDDMLAGVMKELVKRSAFKPEQIDDVCGRLRQPGRRGQPLRRPPLDPASPACRSRCRAWCSSATAAPA